MDILASCSLEESKKFNGKLVVEDENGKSIKVKLNIIETNGDKEVSNKVDANAKCITYIGDLHGERVVVKEGLTVFNEITLEEVTTHGLQEIKGVIPLIRVPTDYCNMKVLADLCVKYPSARIIGGNLLEVEGVRIGRYDEGKAKMSPVYHGVYDAFLEVNLSELDNITEVVKKVKTKLNSEGKPKKEKKAKGVKKEKSSKPKKSSTLANTFNTLFDTNDGEEF